MNTLQDRIRGSLIGGAIGDALGCPVEFIKTSAMMPFLSSSRMILNSMMSFFIWQMIYIVVK